MSKDYTKYPSRDQLPNKYLFWAIIVLILTHCFFYVLGWNAALKAVHHDMNTNPDAYGIVPPEFHIPKPWTPEEFQQQAKEAGHE